MESNLAEKRKRPVWVWIISIYYFFPAAFMSRAFIVVYIGKISHRISFEPIEAGLAFLEPLTALIGAALLFCLRKQTFYFFAINLALKILIDGKFALQKSLFLLAAFGSNVSIRLIVDFIGTLISWGILIAVCFYIKRLEKAGVLK